MKAVVAAVNQEKALVGAFSVITNLWLDLYEALNTVPEDEGQALVLDAGGWAAAEVAGRAAGLRRGQRQAAHGGDAGVQAGAVLLHSG